MTLYLIGIGLNDEKDISIKGLEIVKKCEKIYLETYTSVFQASKEDLEKFYGKEIILADRDLVENKAEQTILKEAKKKEVALLIIGDVFPATTHTDLFLRAKKIGIDVKVIYNASVISAVGITGLQLYKFGKISSMPMDNKNVISHYYVLKDNLSINLHTLFLLDLKANKFLSINEAVEFLLKTEEKEKKGIFFEDTLCVGCSQIGSEKETIIFGKAKDILKKKFDKFPQCLVVPAKLHFMEEEVLELYKI